MKAIIHIGMPKAGSTTIQECLWANRNTLLENGVVYSRMRQGQTPNREIWYAALLLSGADLATDLIAKLRPGQILTAKGNPARFRNLVNKGDGQMRKTGRDRNTMRDAQ